MGDELQAKHEGLKFEVTTTFNELFGEAGKCVDDEEKFWQAVGAKYVAFRRYADGEEAPWVMDSIKHDRSAVKRAVSDAMAVADMRRILNEVDTSDTLESGYRIKLYLEGRLPILMQQLSESKGIGIHDSRDELLADVKLGMNIYKGVFPAYDAFYTKFREVAVNANGIMQRLKDDAELPPHESPIHFAAKLMDSLKKEVVEKDPTLFRRERNVLENTDTRYDAFVSALDAYAAALSE